MTGLACMRRTQSLSGYQAAKAAPQPGQRKVGALCCCIAPKSRGVMVECESREGKRGRREREGEDSSGRKGSEARSDCPPRWDFTAKPCRELGRRDVEPTLRSVISHRVSKEEAPEDRRCSVAAAGSSTPQAFVPSRPETPHLEPMAFRASAETPRRGVSSA